VNYNQLAFWLLFFAVLVPYWRLPHRGQNLLLLVASYAFYSFWDYRFLFLILISTIIDFVGGLGVAGIRVPRRRLLALGGLTLLASVLLCTNHFTDFRVPLGTLLAISVYGIALPRLYALEEQRRRKTFLVISMVANLGILGFFKYFDFFVGSAHGMLSRLGFIEGPAPLLGIILPAGISFYTFQAMSYTIDIYRGECEPTQDFPDFALFVCFFPHLVAGPIMRAHTLLPQVLKARTLESNAVSEGLWLIVIGLFKKMVLSDNMAPIANAVFYRLAGKNTAGMSGAEVLVGIYAFAFQIYGDFSGYSAIARGVSKWLGFELVVNFHLPYLATTPSDFWRRWHISLSTWLRDYLYIPLGGNRGGVKKEYRNLITTMVLGGLWHGASWTFVAWGAYHGLVLCIFRILGIRDAKPSQGVLRYALRLVLMFHLTCAGWLLFRADNFAVVTSALTLMATNFHVTRAALTAFCLVVFYAAILFAFELFSDGEQRLTRVRQSSWLLQGACYSYFVAMILVFRAGKAFEFIYFQF
jgi:D-alanyl-lipoteichoic acid acyltransferase DltB (MBOAT superfamily)